MKPFSLMQPTIFIMVGVPGAGKSFFARRFSEKYKLPIVSADRLRVEMFNQPEYSPGEQIVVNRIADLMTAELLKSNRSFIIDGNSASVRKHRQELQKQAVANNFNLLTIWVQTDPKAAKQRALNRNPKKADDKYNPSMSEKSFNGMAKILTPPNKDENFVVISGKHNFSTQKTTVLRKLPQPREPENLSREHHLRPNRSERPAARRDIPVSGD